MSALPAIEQIMECDKNLLWTVHRLRQELMRNDIVVQPQTVERCLRSLIAQGSVVKKRGIDGLYFYQVKMPPVKSISYADWFGKWSWRAVVVLLAGKQLSDIIQSWIY